MCSKLDKKKLTWGGGGTFHLYIDSLNHYPINVIYIHMYLDLSIYIYLTPVRKEIFFFLED